MNPCPLDGTDQLARHVLAACVEPDGPVDVDGDQACVIDDAPPVLVAEARGSPLPRSPPRPSLASCRCRYRRPRTVCVVPRER